jgi:hypothetical protein
MRWLLFLARVASICNVLFLLCLIILFTNDFIHIEFFNAIIIVLGWILSFPINLIVNATEIILILSRKPSPTRNWLRIFNFIVFILQILRFFFVHHDTFNS